MERRTLSRRVCAFTLIELLIVVAIIAILAAIAVPNFLEAQLRAKVARVKSDMRTISIAMESYCIDNNNMYPIVNGYVGYKIANLIDRGGIYNAFSLSTPIAYLSTTRMVDPFIKSQTYDPYGDVIGQMNLAGNGGNASFSYNYVNVKLYCKNNNVKYDGRPYWYLISLGPDFIKGPNPWAAPGVVVSLNDFARTTYPQDPGHTFDGWQYDPTNGTISKGDIIRHP